MAQAVKLIPCEVRGCLEAMGDFGGLETTSVSQDKNASSKNPIVVSVGRILTWIALLDFVDNAAKSDDKKRNQISLYVDGVRVLSTFMNFFVRLVDDEMAMEDGIGCGEVWQTLLEDFSGAGEDENEAELQVYKNLGSYGFYRTVQCFPGLVKAWWDCDAERNMKVSEASRERSESRAKRVASEASRERVASEASRERSELVYN